MDNFQPYYIPHNKRELIAFLERRYPQVNWKIKKKAQLLAVFCRLRDKEG